MRILDKRPVLPDRAPNAAGLFLAAHALRGAIPSEVEGSLSEVYCFCVAPLSVLLGAAGAGAAGAGAIGEGALGWAVIDRSVGAWAWFARSPPRLPPLAESRSPIRPIPTRIPRSICRPPA